MHAVPLRGSGRVELAAYGLADAEHRVEKELAGLWPGCRVEILEVARPTGGGRIVEEFAVRYRAAGSMEVDAESAEAAKETALRTLRQRLASTRFDRMELASPG